MNIPAAPRSWWEGLDRPALQVQAKIEEPRMQASKIGQWRAINAELGTPRRQRWTYDTGHEGEDA